MEGDQENRDNTRRFLGANGTSREREEREELELSLGLSTNGRFGVDLASKKMRRSSSVSNIVLNVDCAGNEQACGAELGGQAPLARTCSLPPEFDSEARVRMEKLKSLDGGEGLNADGNDSFDANMARDGIQDYRVRELPKASIESRGQQSHLVKGAPQTTKTGGSCAVGGPTVLVTNSDKTLLKNALVDMPYVSTKGFSNKIEGFLYRYKRGEEVKIVCVCHGMFLSPAEFVKHSGGGDVAYPLKHIVVNPFPLY